jgi:hypothetical protein
MYPVRANKHPDSPPPSIAKTEWETIMSAFRSFRHATAAATCLAASRCHRRRITQLWVGRGRISQPLQASHRHVLEVVSSPRKPPHALPRPACTVGRLGTSDSPIQSYRCRPTCSPHLDLPPQSHQVGHCGSPMRPASSHCALGLQIPRDLA